MNEQQRSALRVANEKRGEVRKLRVDVMCGRTDIADVFRDPPLCMATYPLVEVMDLAFESGAKRNMRWRERVGLRAVRDGVNLMVPLGRASQRSREWCAVNAPRPRPGVMAARRAREGAAA